jgi:tripartite-type tricarboxylate transporter receptor subunit TctC
VKDFETVGLVTDVPMVLVARPNFPAADFKELVSHVRAHGDKITYAYVGLGSASHLCGLLFMNAIGSKMTPIFYKGGAPALNDVIAGQVDVYCEPATGPTPHIKAGTIKGYAVTAKSRVQALPDVPTSAEVGLPNFDVTTWYGMYAPHGTPKPVVDLVVAALQKALKDPAIVSHFAELSMEPVTEDRATPAALEQLLKAEIVKWDRIIKDAGITPQ